jgi:hypothetical protein
MWSANLNSKQESTVDNVMSLHEYRNSVANKNLQEEPRLH